MMGEERREIIQIPPLGPTCIDKKDADPPLGPAYDNPNAVLPRGDSVRIIVYFDRAGRPLERGQRSMRRAPESVSSKWLRKSSSISRTIYQVSFTPAVS